MTRSKTIVALVLFVCSSVPLLAEIDLSGSWASINHEDALERGAGPNPADWAGLPFNESGRAKALSFSQSIISMPERTCWFQTQWHIAAGPFSLRMWAVPDPITGKVQAWTTSTSQSRRRPSSSAKARARSELSEPSTPTTMRPRPVMA